LEEVEELMQHFNSDQRERLEEMVLHEFQKLEIEEFHYTALPEMIWDGIKTRIAEPKVAPVRRTLWPRWVAAASITIAVLIGGYYYQSKNANLKSSIEYANDVAPGKTGATLTLANGKKIVLTDAANGELAKEAGVVISKTDDGQLIYEIKETANNANQINTLSTTNGETYRVRLPDQSEVWLNAASTLKYPNSFASLKERRVELSGEAYFEVAKAYTSLRGSKQSQPFIVSTAKQELRVLGTHFNISAYEDEALTKTTLAEGSVKVTALGKSLVLKPNQQAVLSNSAIDVKDVDAEFALAWKSGFFLFNRENLESIMVKIARWYDVQVVYNDPSLKTETFTGTISRFEKISQVFNMLERTEAAKFKIEGKKIIIDKMK